MPLNQNEVLVGAGVVSIGSYTAAGAPASDLADVGHLSAPFGFAPTFNDTQITSERARGPIKVVPGDDVYTLTIPLQQANVENLRIALRQAPAAKQGTTPDFTLYGAQSVEQYHQVKIVGPGTGTNGNRTLEFWRCQVSGFSGYQFAKNAPQLVTLSLIAVFDDSAVFDPGAPSGSFYRLVDA